MFAFAPEIRHLMHTTNATGSLSRTPWKSLRTPGHFPNDTAAANQPYRAIGNAERNWKAPVRHRREAQNQLDVLFGERPRGTRRVQLRIASSHRRQKT